MGSEKLCCENEMARVRAGCKGCVFGHVESPGGLASCRVQEGGLWAVAWGQRLAGVGTGWGGVGPRGTGSGVLDCGWLAVLSPCLCPTCLPLSAYAVYSDSLVLI